MKLNESTEIVSVSMIDVDSGAEKILFEREGRKCHFLPPFPFEKYMIQLRLDWNDMENGDPTLDADIWTEDPLGKKDFLTKGPWHHTLKQVDSVTGKPQYAFNFRNLTLNMKIKMTIGKKHSVDMLLSDTVKVSKV